MRKNESEDIEKKKKGEWWIHILKTYEWVKKYNKILIYLKKIIKNLINILRIIERENIKNLEINILKNIKSY